MTSYTSGLPVSHFLGQRIFLHNWHIIVYNSLFSLITNILGSKLNWIDAKPLKIFFWMYDFRHFAKCKHLERNFSLIFFHATSYNVSILTWLREGERLWCLFTFSVFSTKRCMHVHVMHTGKLSSGFITFEYLSQIY